MNIAWKYLGLLTRQFKDQEGLLSIVALRHEPHRIIEKWIRPRDELRAIVEWAIKQNKAGFNIYASWSLYSKPVRSLETCLWSSAYVADWDAQEPEKIEGMDPTLTVQTSPGRFQEVFIHKLMEVDEAGARYKGLTRRLGCDDISGDPVHLWRVPGTTNWPNAKKKRKPSPSLWDGRVNGKVVLADIIGELGGGGEWPSRHTGKPIGRWLTTALKKRWEAGERSEQFHRIVLGIAKLGWGVDDIAQMMRGTVFETKYGRRLPAEIERSVGKSDLEPPVSRNGPKLIWLNTSDVERKLDFLWYPYLPRDEVTLLDGDGGIGKTSLMLRVAHSLIEGGEMPNGVTVAGGHKVLYVSIEADYSGVTLPLLKRMGITHRHAFAHIEDTEMLMDDEGLVQLDEVMEEHKFDLVVIDSIVDYLPEGFEMNDYKQSSRLILELRSRVALKHHCAVVAMRHNAKGARDQLGHRGMGSMGWHKGSRSQLVVRAAGDIDGQYIVAHTKFNLSAKGPSIGYQFEEVNGRGIIDWVGIVDVSDEEINDNKTDEDRKTKVAACVEWLEGLLKNKGWVSTDLIYEQAETRSFNRRLVQRAGGEMKLKKRMERMGKGTKSEWCLNVRNVSPS